MTTDYGISHEQARSYLHTGRRHLTGGEAKQLEAHLAGCAACRAYAAHLASMEPALTAALHAQWDAALPPLPERTFTDRVRARAVRPRRPAPSWLAAAPLTAGVALLVLVAVWLGSWWGSNSAGPQPTEVVLTVIPTPLPSATALPTPTLPAGLLTRWVAFVTRTNGPHDEIYIMRINGHDGQRLTGLPATLGYDHSLAWSPDGTRLAFVSNRSGHPEVYVAEVGVWAAKQLTELTLPDGETAPTDYAIDWSPNGTLLAVTVFGATAPDDRWIGNEVYLISAAVEGQAFPAQAPRVARGVAERAIWSPDGRQLVYVGPDINVWPALYRVTVPSDATGLAPLLELPVQQLTPSAAAPDGPHDVYLGYAWSPDGTRLAYLRQGPWVGTLFDSETGEGFLSSIEVVSLNATEATRQTLLDLVPSPNGIMGLSWSPDGQYLLYLSDAVTADSLGSGTASSGCWTPRLLPATGGAPVALDGVCYVTRTALPQWSPDGRYLLFTAEAGLVVVDVPATLAGGGHTQPILLPLPAGLTGFPHSPTWQP